MSGWSPRLLRLLLTPLFYLGAVALGWTILTLPLCVDPRTVLWPAVAGFVTAELFLLSGLRLVRLYVVGHELTHWLAAKLCGRRTGRLRAEASRGSIEVDDPNALIVLAPYFVPVYSLAWIGLYGLLRMAVGTVPDWGVALFSAGLGATCAFHLTLTVLALQRGQEDLRLCGPVFSMSVVLFGNLALVFLALVVAGRLWSLGFGLLAQRLADLWWLGSDLAALAAALARRLTAAPAP